MAVQAHIGIIGGGAAGFFLAAQLLPSPQYKITILEKTSQPLQKVKISGGGRCNVTHHCFDPQELVENYPRGKKELLSVFYRFHPEHTFQWFEDRGLPLVIEDDGRVFPNTHSSQSVIDVLMTQCINNQVDMQYNQGITAIQPLENGFQVQTQKDTFEFDVLVMATGSSPQVWGIIERDLQHTIIPPVPSLFSFKCEHPFFQNLQGTSFEQAQLQIPDFHYEGVGPMLITHWGISGPVVLKASSFCAIAMHQAHYEFDVYINFLAESTSVCQEKLVQFKKQNPQKNVASSKVFPQLTKRFWSEMISYCAIPLHKNYADISHKEIQQLSENLTQFRCVIHGKNTYKEEFVTAGGVDLKEINFQSMESKIHEGLYMAGECLNIDAITGGFNFQACWSEAIVISDAITEMFTNNDNTK